MPSEIGVTVVVRTDRPARLRYWIAVQLSALAQRVIDPMITVCDLDATSNACDCACGDVEPYGFVPECGCPTHDPND